MPTKKSPTKTAPAAVVNSVTNIRAFEVRNSSIHGRGVFATANIAKGTRLLEYTGQLISWRVADARYGDDGTRGFHTFLFDLDGKKVIDATVGGNDSRWINHTCNPNCEAVGGRSDFY